MAKYFVKEESLTAIADAIREKTGKTDALTLDQMPAEIAGINGNDGTLLYALPSPIEFDGESTYIDTGVQLMKQAGDFSIVIDFANGTGNSANATLFHCMHEAYPYNGISLQRCAAYTDYVGKWQFGYFDATRYIDAEFQSEDRCRLVISGSGPKINTLAVYNVTTGAVISTGDISIPLYPFASIDESLIIGAYQDSTGNKGRFWKGSLYDFKIFKRAMGDYEANEYLTRPT